MSEYASVTTARGDTSPDLCFDGVTISWTMQELVTGSIEVSIFDPPTARFMESVASELVRSC
jgi:hypothetical protein